MGVAAAGAGLSATGGIVKTILGARQARKAQEAIDNYQRQALTNAYADLEVSTLGADLQVEQMNRTTANTVQALKAGGARALIGGIGKVQQINTDASRQIAADLDNQKNYNEKLEAQGEMQVQNMQERREEADLAGLGQQLSVGQQNIFGGIADTIRGFGAMAGSWEGGGGTTTGNKIGG